MFGQHNSYQQMQDQSTPLYAQQSPYLQQGSYAQHSPQPQYQQPASYEAHHQQLTTYDSQYGGYQTKQSASPTGSSRLRKRLERLGRYLKIMMLVSTVISLILSLVMEAAMIYMTYAFYSTKNKTASGSKGQVTPWAKETILWPTYLLLGASGVSVLGAAVILVMLCCNFRKRMAFKLVYYLLQVVLWVTVAVVYRLSKGTRDMWGWACHNEATERQQLFKEVVNFTSLCKLQVSSAKRTLDLTVADSSLGCLMGDFSCRERNQATLHPRRLAGIEEDVQHEAQAGVLVGRCGCGPH